MNTRGFRDVNTRNRHHQEHGAEFGCSSPAAYEAMADDFWKTPCPPHIAKCLRSKEDRLRYDPASGALGVIDGNHIIRTFFKPVPCASLSPAVRATFRTGGCHGYATNLLYFKAECTRW